MSDEKKKAPEASSPNPGGSSIAESYLKDQLEQARKSLGTTRMVMGGLALFVLCYMSFITYFLSEFLHPKGASDVVMGSVGTYASDYSDKLLTDLAARIPEMMATMPDEIMGRMPQLRENFERQLVESITEHATESSQNLGAQLDEFIAENHKEIGELLAASDDQAAVDALGEELHEMFMEQLKLPVSADGESMLEKIQVSKLGLAEIRDHVSRLANANDLTDHEKKQRRVIAIIGRTVDKDL